MKKIQRYFFYIIAIWCAMCLFLRCYMNMAGMQTGRTAGDGNVELTGSIGQTNNAPFFLVFQDDQSEDSYEVREKLITPDVDIRVGFSDRFDLGLTMSIAKFGLTSKYNIFNYRDKFSMAGGLSAGHAIGGKYFQAQLFASIHPTEKMAIYCNPTYSLALLSKYSSTTFFTDNLDFYGANIGFLYGSKTQLGVDVGVYTMAADSKEYAMLQLGIGVKFLFGDKQKAEKIEY